MEASVSFCSSFVVRISSVLFHALYVAMMCEAMMLRQIHREGMSNLALYNPISYITRQAAGQILCRYWITAGS